MDRFLSLHPPPPPAAQPPKAPNQQSLLCHVLRGTHGHTPSAPRTPHTPNEGVSPASCGQQCSQRLLYFDESTGPSSTNSHSLKAKVRAQKKLEALWNLALLRPGPYAMTYSGGQSMSSSRPPLSTGGGRRSPSGRRDHPRSRSRPSCRARPTEQHRSHLPRHLRPVSGCLCKRPPHRRSPPPCPR